MDLTKPGKIGGRYISLNSDKDTSTHDSTLNKIKINHIKHKRMNTLVSALNNGPSQQEAKSRMRQTRLIIQTSPYFEMHDEI